MLYVYLETLLLLERLHIKQKWRHCSLHQRSIVVQKTTEKGLLGLAGKLREDEQENGQMGKAERDAWIALEVEARSLVIQEDDSQSFYHTDNRNFLFIHVENARQVDMNRLKDPRYSDTLVLILCCSNIYERFRQHNDFQSCLFNPVFSGISCAVAFRISRRYLWNRKTPRSPSIPI